MVCGQCNGICCKKFSVFVTAHDAARIAKNLSLEPTYFLDFYPVEVDSKFPVFKLKGKDYVLGLDTKDGSMKDCKFLMNVSIYGRCGIHRHRPMNCRTYPFVLKDGKLGLVEEHLCPKQWYPEGKEREQYIKDIRKSEKELKEYEKIINIWNRNFGERGSFVEFLNFILKEVEK